MILVLGSPTDIDQTHLNSKSTTHYHKLTKHEPIASLGSVNEPIASLGSVNEPIASIGSVNEPIASIGSVNARS